MNPKDRAGSAKPNLSILPFAPLYEAIPAIYEGRRKYGVWNWRREQISETIYADAAIRHLMQFISGEDIDPDSGVHHISKAIAGLLVVRDAMIHGTSIDDRRVEQNLNIPGIMKKLAEVDKMYPNPIDSPLDSVDEAVGPLKVEAGDILICKNGKKVRVKPSCKDKFGDRESIIVHPVDGSPYARHILLDKWGVAEKEEELEAGWSIDRGAMG